MFFSFVAVAIRDGAALPLPLRPYSRRFNSLWCIISGNEVALRFVVYSTAIMGDEERCSRWHAGKALLACSYHYDPKHKDWLDCFFFMKPSLYFG